MSTQGTATVPGVAVVAIGEGMALAVVAATGAVVGVGILIGKGMVWCYRKMEENYQNVCKEWRDLYDRAYAESRANIRDIDMRNLTAQQLALASANLDAPWKTDAHIPSPVASTRDQKILDDVFALVRSIDNDRSFAQAEIETERALLANRLQFEIIDSRGVLAAEQIVAAEAALHASPDALQQAISNLQSAWAGVTEEDALRERQARRASRTLNMIAGQLNTADTMLYKAGGTQNAVYNNQRGAIEAQAAKARALLETDPARALNIATSAGDTTRALVDKVSDMMLTAWEKTRKEVNTLQGILASLSRMTEEACMVKLIDEQKAGSLARRITAAQNEVGAITQSAASDIQQRLAQLSVRIELLKEDVFNVVKVSQQRNIAQTIAMTLGELDFQSYLGGQPLLRENGDVMRIEATRAGNTVGFGRDDKVVSFDISPEGDITYDFSGYVGDSCLHEAERIFAALRAKGIFILDTNVANNLPDTITADTLAQTAFQPHFTANKVQAALAERLKHVLEQMSYPNIRQSAVGGCIELEAFKGQVGYHVVLTPEGSVQVFKDASHSDVSTDPTDPVVTEIQRELEEEVVTDSLDEQQRTTSIKARKQQMLGY